MSGTNPFRRKTNQQSSRLPIASAAASVPNASENEDRPEPRIPPIDTGRNILQLQTQTIHLHIFTHAIANALQTFHARQRQRLARLFGSFLHIPPHPTARMAGHTDSSPLRPSFPLLPHQICYRRKASKMTRRKTLSVRNPTEQAGVWRMRVRGRIPCSIQAIFSPLLEL